ncbi:sensor histidine kinase [Chengkuizengella sediminis]|uniref:sensor histidine kinase n=1 Tax=Chengkuizengella sediminis TaxID=1885917 RepID=UPI0013895882|nr:ATP-binding protein [Chengkuizengella sediminis]NDI36864.1 hypothetical protein [Chengkuizengella sediminis]
MLKKLSKKTLIIFVLISQIWFFYITLNFPNSSIIINKSLENTWYVEQINSIGNNFGLEVGDIIHKVNNSDSNNYYTIQKWRTVEQFESILIIRDGVKFEVIPTDYYHLSRFDIISFISVFFCYLVAYILYKNVYNSKAARLLSLIFVTIAIIFTSLGASTRGDTLGIIFNLTTVGLIPILFLHFLYILFKEKADTILPIRKIHIYLYYFIIITIFPQIMFYLPLSNIYEMFSIIRNIIMLYFLFSVLIIFLNLTILYLKYRKKEKYVSTLIKTIWISLLISTFPFSIFSFLPDLLSGKEWISSIYTCWFGLLFPLSFAYLLISKKLYDIEIIFRRFLFTIIISIIPSGIIVFSNELTYTNSLLNSHYIVSFIITTFILSLLLYSFEYLTTKFQRIIFPKRYYLNNALKKISQNLRSISSFHELKDITLVDIVKTMNVFGGAIIFKYNDSIETISEGDIDLNKATKMIETSEVNHDYICFEITDHEEYTSYLVLTKKKTNTVIGMEESQWINLIITYLAVNLENLYLIRKLTMKLEQLAVQIPDEKTANEFLWFRKFMFELQEKERVRIATDLHDTTMQDLFFLKRRLNALIETNDINHKHANEIKNIVSYVEIINVNLRQSCFELHPYLLQEAGLIHAIRKLIQQESEMNTFEIEFSIGDEYQIEKRNSDTKSHIFRMIQEMITNTKKHAQATKVNISLQIMNHEIQLQFEDNGIGFNEQINKEQDTLKSGMGMEQIKSRVLYLNGQFKVESSIGKGAKFWITLPNKEEKSA